MKGLRVVGLALLAGGIISYMKGSQFGVHALVSSLVFVALGFTPWERLNAERRR